MEINTNSDIIKTIKKLKRIEERYRIVNEATNDIIWEGDLINNKRVFSGKLNEILGYSSEELERIDEWFSIIHPDDIKLAKEGLANQVREKRIFDTFEYRVKSKDGNYKWVRSNTKCKFNEDGEAVSIFGAFTDITKLKEHQKKIHDLAYYDSITGLPNKVMLSEITVQKIKGADEEKSKFAMIFIDLDNFKVVNDSYGHIVGDKLLIELGKRLEQIRNNKVMTFRLGGDEFVVLIEGIEGKGEVKNFLKYMNEVLTNPIEIDKNNFYISYSGGVVIYPEDGNEFHELLKNADTALYKAKGLGKGINSFYNVKMGEAAVEKARIQSDLYSAIKNQEFKIYYQPIVGIDGGEIKGCEALIRWIHPKNGLISPEKFIESAEENGTIIEIGKWVFENACKYAKRMYDKGYKDFYVSINISPKQLIQNDFVDFILGVIKEVGILPEMVVLEVTESVLIEFMDIAVKKLMELRNNNIKIALDDFGCGYSSLTYLKRLPIDVVKIDRSFIADIESEDDEKNMTSIILLLARLLDLKVIAEGVEFIYQQNYLKKNGCDMFQGYLISKPVPEDEFTKLMEVKNNFHSS